MSTNVQAPTSSLSRGMPVEVAKINRSLTQLWEQESDQLSKASLVNFAVYSEASDALSFNTQLMAEVTRQHACRVILLAANPSAQKQRVQAWISAHCHVTGASGHQVCSEQIAFLIEGGGPEVMRSILFSHLDSDLPLYLWWQGQFGAGLDEQLWGWVDRFFFDSHGWREPGRQIQILRDSVAGAGSRCVLCDLNWRRLIYLRLAIAQTFDHPWAAAKIGSISEVEIVHDPEYWVTAILLVSWLANQLGWELERKGDFTYTFSVPMSGQIVQVKLKAVPGQWVGEVRFHFAQGFFDVSWNGNFLESTLSEHPEMKQLLPAGGTSLAGLLKEELVRGGEHLTYLRALNLAEKLWE
jgi:glucose-6-phosphate dehydrogenase assembly protein OpcA